jgi:RNA polymerase sigma-70 factor, ECF subfamily
MRLLALLLLSLRLLQTLRPKRWEGWGFMGTLSAIGINGDSDSGLLAAAKQGDTYAFEKLVLRYKRRILAMAQRITKNREDAEDVVQDTFHKIFIHLHEFQERSQFSTWLTRIAMNEAFMLLRRRRGVIETLSDGSDEDGKSSQDAFVDHNPSPEESCWHRERKELLTEAIGTLSPKVRRTVVLRNIEEHSLEETSQILGTSIGVVKSRLFQGRRKLRRVLNPGLFRRAYTSTHAEAQRY